MAKIKPAAAEKHRVNGAEADAPVSTCRSCRAFQREAQRKGDKRGLLVIHHIY